MKRFSIFCGVCLALVSCVNDEENGNSSKVESERIYFDYKISAEEGRDAAVMLQYRVGGKDGNTLAIEEPGKVVFDGAELKADSARLTGFFYELIRPIDEFKGPHTIVFIDRNKKQHKEEFKFEPFRLAAELPESIKKAPFVIKLDEVDASPVNIRLVITDTSHSSPDVNEEMLITKGEIKVDEKMLNALTTGPVALEIYKEETRPLRERSRAGGRISITYGLKRQFELID